MGQWPLKIESAGETTMLSSQGAAGEELFGTDRTAIGALASELGLEGCLSGDPARTVQLEIDGSNTRWEIIKPILA